LRIHPGAARDARRARRWYSERNPEAAARFLEEYKLAVQTIAEFPERWPPYLHNTRRLHLHRFPYWVIYRVEAVSVLVVAVAHDRQRPGYWRRRTF
jgi:plasmid stabilization system protein ParE